MPQVEKYEAPRLGQVVTLNVGFMERLRKKGGHASGGNFANDPEKASEAGKKGGEHSHGGGHKS